jgi:hypothetical protein
MSKQQSPHLPFTLQDDKGWPILLDAYGEYVAKLATFNEARFVLAACNSYDELVALLEEAHDQIDCITADPVLDSERESLKGRISAALQVKP